ncbi:MAG: glycosyltransferase family 2 protein [Anaerolineae bacterium]|nr:glycosyltransferase family 2 protein [Anaerolineae bacterium]
MTESIDKSLWPETIHKRWISEQYEPGLVSVIMPAYNRAHLMTEAMDSVFVQTYRPIELIIIDDGSTDDTARVVEEWHQDHKHDAEFEVHYFRQENKGCAAGRNSGLLLSRGEYIQFLDTDDKLSSRKIADQMACARKHPDHLIHGPWRLFRVQDGSLYIGVLNSPDSGRYSFTSGGYLRTWCMGYLEPPHCFLWPRQWMYRIGPWDEILVGPDDVEYLGRAFMLGIQLAYAPGGVAYYRLHSDAVRISGSISEQTIKSMFRMCERMELGFRQLGLWDTYGRLLAYKYYEITRKSAVHYPKHYRAALRQYKRLRDPSDKRVGTARHRIMARLLGIRGAEILSHLIRKMGISVHTIPMTACSSYEEMERIDISCSEALDMEVRV